MVKVGRSYVYDLSTKLPCVTFFTKVVTQLVQFLDYSGTVNPVVEDDIVLDQEWSFKD